MNEERETIINSKTKREVANMKCPAGKSFPAGYDVQKKHISSEYKVIISGDCLVSGVFFSLSVLLQVKQKVNSHNPEFGQNGIGVLCVLFFG